MKLQTKAVEAGWSDLCIKYREWEDMAAKGKLRMKKKTNKDGKDYYDFDYSRYQYYYSYPEDHIALAPPQTQKQFINYVLNRYTENFSHLFVDSACDNWPQIEEVLKPLSLYQFLKQINEELDQKITTLRIQKALRIKKMRAVLGPEAQVEKSAIDIIEAEIRSYTHKQIRISNRYSELGKSLSQRLQAHKSNLKTRAVDELKFADISKSDFVVFMRMRQAKRALQFNFEVLRKMVGKYIEQNQQALVCRARQAKAKQIRARRNKFQLEKTRLIQQVVTKVTDRQSHHFDNSQNRVKLESLIDELDFIRCLQRNIQQNISKKLYSPVYTNLGFNYEEVTYVPFNRIQLKQRLTQKLKYYFNKTLIEEQIMNSSDEHICYKVNNLCFLQLKTLWETYNFAHKKEQSALIKIRSMMRKQLELVFSRHVGNLLRIRQHSIKVPTHEKWHPNLLHTYKPASEKESIMEAAMQAPDRFKDPTTCSLIALLGVNTDTAVREEIERYVARAMEVSRHLYSRLALYHANVSGDEKVLALNILGAKLAINPPVADANTSLYLQALQQVPQQQKIDSNILRSYYMLSFLRTSECMHQLMQILNAQLMCMIKVQSRLKLLWNKSKLPFNMSKQFISRFTQPNEINGNAFDFVVPELAEGYLEGVFKQMYNEDADRDFIEWNAEVGIEVRRRKSDNPLLSGKSNLYQQSKQLLQQSLQRVEFLCSETIRLRETFMPQPKLAYICDRIELIFDFMSLERAYQEGKLRLLDIYCQQLLQSVSAEAIMQTYTHMCNTMHCNKVVDLTQTHFARCYQLQTECLNSKAEIVRCLMAKQKKLEKSHIDSTFMQFRRANLSSNLPEISSMYYVEEAASQDHEIIEQAAEDYSDTVSEVDSQVQGTHGRLSEVSSMLGEGSQYHLKVSFQQILAQNTITAIKQDNNAKEQLMNRKKQKIINDSLLGGMIPRNVGTAISKSKHEELYSTLDVVVVLAGGIDHMLRGYSTGEKLQAKSLILKQLVTLVQQFEFSTYIPVIKPEQLTVTLNWGHKTLNKFVEKVRNQGPQGHISSRSSNQHWLCINSKIMDKIMSNQTGQQIDGLRGLYLCLNAISVNDCHYKVKQIQALQRTGQGEASAFRNFLKQHYSGLVMEIPPQLSATPGYETRNNCMFRLKAQLRQVGQLCYLGIGNYNLYYRAICGFEMAVNHLLYAFNSMMRSEVEVAHALESEIKIMEGSQCCGEMFDVLARFNGVDNRVFLRKKLEVIAGLKKSYFSRQRIEQLLDTFQKCTANIPKFVKTQVKTSLAQMSALAYDFQLYINQITKSALLLNSVANEVLSQVQARNQTRQLDRLIGCMPHVSRNLHIELLPNTVLHAVFKQSKQVLDQIQQQPNRSVELCITEPAYSLKQIVEITLASGERLYSWIVDECLKRKKQQLKDENRNDFQRYIDRHFAGAPAEPTIAKALHNHTKQKEKNTRITLLRQWMQAQLIIFGCGLTQDELLRYRKLLINPYLMFPVFWSDNSKYIISTKDLSQMRNHGADAKQIVARYKQEYLTEQRLKKSYASFIEDLAEFDFEDETTDTFLVLYTGASEFFRTQGNQEAWSFLSNFCCGFDGQPVGEIDQLFNFLKVNMATPSERRPSQTYSIDRLKYELWNSDKKEKLKMVDSIRRVAKQRISESKSLAIKKVKDEIGLPFFARDRILEILTYLDIAPSDYKLGQQDFLVNFDKFVHEGYINLSPKEHFICNLSQKSLQSKTQLTKYREQVVKIISGNHFFMKLIREKYLAMCYRALDRELAMRRFLQEDAQNEQVSRDKLIFKQTINKILVPKVKLNPFLSSPLKIDNYFFAGTIKISYIDQFLNKLRNRAVLIELAEGGIGYLLKVNELDESVDLLCKAIVGFSEKQFADRFRTVFDVLQETKERNSKLVEENNNLKEIIKAAKAYQHKEIKSLLYEKLNDYIVSFYAHQKQYNIVINLLKGFENKMEQLMSKKFGQKIQLLQSQIKKLNEKILLTKAQATISVQSEVSQIKDKLYEKFKQKAEEVLDTRFIEDIPGGQKFETKQSHDSSILLNKLKMQKSFYQLKISKIETKLTDKIKNLEKKLLEQNKLQNLLLMEQQKNKCLAQEVKQLQRCSVENELLKKEMQKKQEEQVMQRFRLVKVNQSLKGKLKRIEDEVEQEKVVFERKIESLSKIQTKTRSNFSVQVTNSELSKSKAKSFHIKTEHSPSPSLQEVNVWKQKWGKAEKKSQLLIEGVRRALEIFVFSKNGTKLIDNLRQLINEHEKKRNQTYSSFGNK